MVSTEMVWVGSGESQSWLEGSSGFLGRECMIRVHVLLPYIPSLVKTTGLPWVFPIEIPDESGEELDEHAGRDGEGYSVSL